VIYLFSSFIKLENNIGAESLIINSGLSIFGILASVWIGLNIYNTIEKNELNKVVENSKNEIQIATKKLEDIARIQVESTIADSQENLDEKLMHYDNMIDKYNDYDLPYIFRANFMFKNNKYKEAISDYTIALLKNSDNKYLCYDRGKCYYFEEDYSKAANDFTNAINCTLYLNSSTKNRAAAYQKLECYDKAIRDYTEIINSMDPDHSTYNNRGACYLELKKYDFALDDFNMAIELGSKDDKSYYKNRIFANVGLDNFREAISDIDYIIDKIGSNDMKLYAIRSVLNKKLGNEEESKNDFMMFKKLKAEAALTEEDESKDVKK
jgi:tetratricopeptide (TPR) repeat protein